MNSLNIHSKVLPLLSLAILLAQLWPPSSNAAAQDNAPSFAEETAYIARVLELFP